MALTPQTTALIQQILTIVGMVLTSFGWVSSTEWQGFMQNLSAAIGPMMALVGFIWSFVSNRTSAIVTQVANMPEVYKVEVNDPALARNDVTPPNVTTQGQPVGGVGSRP
jgi:hypothetical protein